MMKAWYFLLEGLVTLFPWLSKKCYEALLQMGSKTVIYEVSAHR